MLISRTIAYQHNTDYRKYIGAFEIIGSTWRVYHEAGHSDLNTSTGAVTHLYYVRDYLGSTRAVIDESGNVLQSTAYYPSGVPLTPNTLTPQTIKLHTGKDYFDLQGAGLVRQPSPLLRPDTRPIHHPRPPRRKIPLAFAL